MGFGDFTPNIGNSINATSKWHFLACKHVIMTHAYSVKVRPRIWAGRDKQRFPLFLMDQATLKIALFPWKIWTPSNTRVLAPTRTISPNCISISLCCPW